MDAATACFPPCLTSLQFLNIFMHFSKILFSNNLFAKTKSQKSRKKIYRCVRVRVRTCTHTLH